MATVVAPRMLDTLHSRARTAQEENAGPPNHSQSPEADIPVAMHNSVHHSVRFAGDSNGTDTEWEVECDIVTARRFRALKDEADG